MFVGLPGFLHACLIIMFHSLFNNYIAQSSTIVQRFWKNQVGKSRGEGRSLVSFLNMSPIFEHEDKRGKTKLIRIENKNQIKILPSSWGQKGDTEWHFTPTTQVLTCTILPTKKWAVLLVLMKHPWARGLVQHLRCHLSYLHPTLEGLDLYPCSAFNSTLLLRRTLGGSNWGLRFGSVPLM